ncbi:helix-turn-helix domain-containing protein [Nitrolancea hollandica]|uniref:Uncharacterized protein n=1 Tax=Nitrolancea hollandica Lb TaxID=1129897 RepID=I4EH02_9BACT|nr:hypothetical protein NITHO_2920006 [Nitrolancea hollandica Lb]
MIVRSWAGKRTTTIARVLGCHPQTVRERIVRFNAEGIDGRPSGTTTEAAADRAGARSYFRSGVRGTARQAGSPG